MNNLVVDNEKAYVVVNGDTKIAFSNVSYLRSKTGRSIFFNELAEWADLLIYSRIQA